MMRIMTILGAGLMSLVQPATSHAGPLDFMFSFSNTIGNVNGTVTGEIFGLTDNAAGQAATNVVVDSYPAGLDLPTPPLTVFTGVIQNSFTVASEMITAASFQAFDVTLLDALDLDIGGANILSNNSLGVATINSEGFAGATYSLVQPIPEPSSVTLLGTGLGFAAIWPLRRRLRRRAASA